MIDLNNLILEQYGLISWQGIKARLYYPQWYQANSIADFLEHKNTLETTVDKLFLIDKKLVGAAAVVVHNCNLRYVREPKRIDKLWKMDLSFLRLHQELGIISEEQQEMLSSMRTEYHNAVLVDPTGEIPVYASDDVPTALHRIWIIHRPRDHLSYVGSYSVHGYSRPERKLDAIYQLVPIPAV